MLSGRAVILRAFVRSVKLCGQQVLYGLYPNRRTFHGGWPVYQGCIWRAAQDGTTLLSTVNSGPLHPHQLTRAFARVDPTQ